MSVSDDSDMGNCTSPRERSSSILELMMKLSTSSPSSPTEGPTIGGSLLDVICVNHSSKPGNITLYEDRLRTNIIGEQSLKYYSKDNQGKNPVVRRAYAEVPEIDRVSYRSLCIITKVGERHVPITAHIIPGLVMPLLVGMDFRDAHIECLTLQKQVNELNSPRIYFFKDKKAPTSRMSIKQVRRIHRVMDHPDHTQMTTVCIRLGHKVDKTVELWISRIIQECQVCKNKSRLFFHGHGNKYNTRFNTDVLVRREVMPETNIMPTCSQ